MKLIIAGGTKYTDYNAMLQALVDMEWDPEEVVSAGLEGADHMAVEWAIRTGRKVATFPAEWMVCHKWGDRIRDKKMVEYADAMLALPGTRRYLLRLAKRKGLIVYQI